MLTVLNDKGRLDDNAGKGAINMTTRGLTHTADGQPAMHPRTRGADEGKQAERKAANSATHGETGAHSDSTATDRSQFSQQNQDTNRQASVDATCFKRQMPQEADIAVLLLIS